VLPNIAADNHIEPITDKVRQVDWHHGFTAAAGHEIYTARTYPREYWNRVAFISEPTGHLTEPLWAESRAVSLARVDEPRALAAAALRLLTDDGARRELAARGRDLYARRFALRHTIGALRGAAHEPCASPS